MPNKNTFSIKPIAQFIKKHTTPNITIIDPFPDPFKTDALIYLKSLPDNHADLILYDPIYSRRQRNEIYILKNRGEGKDYQSHPKYFKSIEDQFFRICKDNGKVLKFMWNTKSISGFSPIDGIIVPHGGLHNDTICTAFIKIQQQLGAWLE